MITQSSLLNITRMITAITHRGDRKMTADSKVTTPSLKSPTFFLYKYSSLMGNDACLVHTFGSCCSYLYSNANSVFLFDWCMKTPHRRTNYTLIYCTNMMTNVGLESHCSWIDIDKKRNLFSPDNRRRWTYA